MESPGLMNLSVYNANSIYLIEASRWHGSCFKLDAFSHKILHVSRKEKENIFSSRERFVISVGSISLKFPRAKVGPMHSVTLTYINQGSTCYYEYVPQPYGSDSCLRNATIFSRFFRGCQLRATYFF